MKDVPTELGNWDINFLNAHLFHTIVNQLMSIPSQKEIDDPNSNGSGDTNT